MSTRKAIHRNRTLYTREEAIALAPAYVKFVEDHDHDSLFQVVLPAFEKLKFRQTVITFDQGAYVRCIVSAINHNDYRAVDGPVVRVSDGEFSWRVDGDRYAFPIP
jgi:hypothetical protein